MATIGEPRCLDAGAPITTGSWASLIEDFPYAGKYIIKSMYLINDTASIIKVSIQLDFSLLYKDIELQPGETRVLELNIVKEGMNDSGMGAGLTVMADVSGARAFVFGSEVIA